ncbi:MAG: heparinase II/III family protein [Lentisphaerae bacterium]|nr:heparinase II/III family protein [Lentisphaerota bacterium]
MMNPKTPTWSELVDRMEADSVRQLVAKADEILKAPIVRRVYRYEDVGKHRTWLDLRAKLLHETNRRLFALAMSDMGTANLLSVELPILAAAYRRTGAERFLSRVSTQLEEAAAWSPIQRPGWMCYTNDRSLPADGKDGSWLATGRGVRAICDALEILPEGACGDELRGRLKALLAAEIEGVVDDWRAKRQWFVRWEDPITNQWVLPTEGLVRACLFLGRDTHGQAYELGVTNLLKAMDAHGAAGEFEEGIGYAAFTVDSMLHAARAMAAQGDRRALDHVFLRHFPQWMIHHIQPGRMTINCFDAGGACLPRSGGQFQSLLSLILACANSAEARWALQEHFDGPSNDLPGLIARALINGPCEAPPLFAVYDKARRVNWRDSWNDDATGVWIRGGHKDDQHDHQDRGHVNFVARGRPILIEAGTPAYHHPEIVRLFKSGVGHNVLQLGTAMPDTADCSFDKPPLGWQKFRTVAPLTVASLDVRGGRVIMDGTECYDGLKLWRREVEWTAAKLAVEDVVILANDRRDTLLFRWHLGTSGDVNLSGTGARWTAEWPAALITLEASAPIVVSRTDLPDHTLKAIVWDDDVAAYSRHVCLVVQTIAPENTVKISMQALPR